MSGTADAKARAIVAELVRGRLAIAPINVVQTVGWLMMLQSEPPDPSHFIGRWLAAMTERGREQITRQIGNSVSPPVAAAITRAIASC
jgi:site-specific DNA-cytosine methylase